LLLQGDEFDQCSHTPSFPCFQNETKPSVLCDGSTVRKGEIYLVLGCCCRSFLTSGISRMVVFAETQLHVVYGVLNGTFDVGFFGADQVDRMGLDPEDFKVIDPKIYIMDDGNIYPFLHSTEIFAEWPFSAFTHGMFA
jgi:hypothetical protein